MSYLVFARKWRPQTFDDVVGQDNVVQTLKNAIKNNRLAHAYIFAGPRGVGKTSAARILAKSLNCQGVNNLNPCNKCPSCLEIAGSRSLDVIEIDGASNRGIDDIRVLRENVKFAPAGGKFKIYIIDEVHQITPEGFNALLKTLEEPPPYVKFIFATTHPQKIPSTIISRCQFLEFRRISNLNIIKQLREIASAEKIEVQDDVLLALAKASDGSMRDAESILDELVSFAKADIKLSDVYSVLGVVEQEYLFEMAQKLIKKDAASAIQFLDQLLDRGKEPGQLLINLIEHYRNLMIAKVSALNQEKLLDLPLETCQQIAGQSQQLSLDDILAGFNAFVRVQETARYMDNIRIPFEVALVKLCYSPAAPQPKPAPQPSLRATEGREASGLADRQAIPAKIASSSERIVGTPRNDHLKISQSIDRLPKEAAIDFEKVQQLWPEFLERVNKIKVSAAHYLEGASPLKSSGSVLTIGFPQKSSFNRESLERKENMAVLENVWKALLNQELKINFSLVNEVSPLAKARGEDIDPAVQSAISAFNGRVVRKS